MATRRERVVLELEDQFSTQMAKAAASAALLKRELDSLSGTAVRTSRDTDVISKSTRTLGDDMDKTGRSADGAGKSIDKFSGRLRLLTEAALVLGPALVPIGAVAIPAITGLTAAFTATAAAAGVAVMAFNGVGDALTALDAYQLEPTRDNLEKMRAEFDKIGPAGAEFVRYLDSIGPQLRSLQMTAREGLFPGVEDGIDSLLTILPQVRRIIFDLATEMGRLASEAGEGLSGEGFAAFFDYLETDAAPTLAQFGHTIGNLAEGFANLMVAFAPLSRDFTGGMEAMSRSFADWAAGLSRTDGFRSFVEYVREAGPQVIDMLGALGNAFVGIIQAAAPFGQAVVPALTALANVLATIASSPIGPPLFTAVAALTALNRISSLAAGGMARFGVASAKAVGTLDRFAGTAAGVVAVGAAVGALADNIGRIDSENLDRSLTALGRGDVTDTIQEVIDSIEELNAARNFVDLGEIVTAGGLFGDSTLDKAADNINQLDQALAQMVETGDRVQAQALFDQLIAQAEKSGVSAEDAAKGFDAYKLALENVGSAAEGAASATSSYAGANRQAANWAGLTKTEVRGLVSAMEEQRASALAAFDAVTQYAQALAAARKRAKESEAGINANTAAGRENRNALSQLAGAWNNQSDAVRNNVAKAAEARRAFIQTAIAMGVSEDKARDLARRLLEIPKSVVTKIETRDQDALAAIRRIRAELDSIPREIRTTYYVNQVNAINKGGFEPNPDARGADGMTVPGKRAPYRDKVLAFLAPGEEVISNRHGQADRNRELLKAINANRFADGGTAGVASAVRIGPNSQLYGINRAFLSVRELADRISNLSAKQIRGLAGDIDRLSKVELKKLGRALDLATKAAEKEWEASKERLDEEREQLRALKDARREFANAVTGNFRSSLFGDVDLVDALRNGQLPSEVLANIKGTGDGGAVTEDDVRAYLDTLSASQLTSLQAQANFGILGQDTRDARAFQEALAQLRKMGLKGGAYQELAASGNLGQAQALLTAGPQQVEALMQSYQIRNQALGGLGASVGNAEFGRAIQRQVRITERAADIAAESREELREVKHAVRDLNRRIEHLNKVQEKAPQETGKEVGKAINDGVSTGGRRTP